jgi:hypothetical protein
LSGLDEVVTSSTGSLPVFQVNPYLSPFTSRHS